jgi:hypothetical protein
MVTTGVRGTCRSYVDGVRVDVCSYGDGDSARVALMAASCVSVSALMAMPTGRGDSRLGARRSYGHDQCARTFFVWRMYRQYVVPLVVITNDEACGRRQGNVGGSGSDTKPGKKVYQ